MKPSNTNLDGWRAARMLRAPFNKRRGGHVPLCIIPVFLSCIPTAFSAEAPLIATDVAVGRNLQTAVTIALPQPAPEAGVQMTIKSSDGTRLVVSKSPVQPGSDSLVLQIRAGFRESPEFWLQGRAAEGSAKYTASAPGYAEGSGTVTLTPSAIVLIGPYKAPSFPGIVGGPPVKLTLTSARLDPSLKYVEEQLLVAASPLKVELLNSKKTVGEITGSPALMQPATSTAVAVFQSHDEGETVVSVIQPSGFSAPAEFAKWTANIQKPGLALSDHLMIGQNLQVAGFLSLGAAAPAKGTSITLVSEDPTRLLLSSSGTTVGSASVTLTVKPGEAGCSYYLQALKDSGTVKYSATGAGYRDRTAAVTLAPSGIVFTPQSQGPPDEAHVLRSAAPESMHMVAIELSHPSKTSLVAWTVQLDPVTHRGADITVQPLRAGMTVTIPVTNSKPEIGKIPPSLTLKGGSEHVTAEFVPMAEGTTTISVGTPEGFTQAANSTAIMTVVRK